MRKMMISAAAVAAMMVGYSGGAMAGVPDHACPPGGDNTNWTPVPDTGGEGGTDSLYYRGYSSDSESEDPFKKGQYTTVTIVTSGGGDWQQPGKSPTPQICTSAGSVVCTVNGPANSQGEPTDFTNYLINTKGCTEVNYIN